MVNLPPREPPDLRNRGSQGLPEYPRQPGGTGPLPPGQGVPPAQAPQLGSRSYGTGNLQPNELPDLRPRKKSSVPGLPGITERRIEYLAWGTVVLLFGCAVIFFALDTGGTMPYIRVGIPLLSGVILLGSGMVQRFLDPQSENVSMFTWAMAILGIALGATELIAVLTDSSLRNEIIYFVGFLILISGIVIILQVFNPHPEDQQQ